MFFLFIIVTQFQHKILINDDVILDRFIYCLVVSRIAQECVWSVNKDVG